MPLTNPNTAALQKANNLSDLANAASAWLNLGANQSLADNAGWIKLPNGLILQWRRFTVASQQFTGGTIYNFDITFPIAFNTVYQCVGCQNTTMPATFFMNLIFDSLTNSKVTARIVYQTTLASASPTFTVFAIGV
ncbi:hypothetical protein BCD64_12045 [Nostoc sp. MBR 210]|nr:hypothetical protein BCD64_12045 [Nostoc sp. MBR 210]